MKNKKVAVVIVNWNGLKFLENCLTSIFDQSYQNFDVYFVDNGSNDGSVNFVKEKFSKAKVIELKKNTGFAHANNVAINMALKDSQTTYILTLNNDTKTDKNFVSNLVHTMDTNPRIGSVAPKIKFFYEQNLIDCVGLVIGADGSGMNRGFKEIDNGQYDKTEDVFGACAGAALYRRTALENVSYNDEFFDDSFFAYYEDLDLAWRLRLMNWESSTCPEAVVLHIHSGTAGSHSLFKAYYVNRNRFFVMFKVLPIKYLLVALAKTPLRYTKLLNSMFFKKRGPSFNLKNNSNSLAPFLVVFKGLVSFLWNMPFLLIKRYHIQRRKKASSRDVKSWLSKYKANMDDMIYK